MLEEKLARLKPDKHLTLSIHLDGQRDDHDLAVCHEGSYEIAAGAIRAGVDRGFRVTTNTTLFDGADPERIRAYFDHAMELGVEGMMLSPGYAYDKAPDQGHFLGRAKIRRLFRTILSNRKTTWRFNMSPLFLEFLMGRRHYPCTPWGMPTFNIFGWQRPCYLLQDGYTKTFAELLEDTPWHRYGTESGNPSCANCMVHSGYEASAVNDSFGSLRGFLSTVRASIFSRYRDYEAHGFENKGTREETGLVQIQKSGDPNRGYGVGGPQAGTMLPEKRKAIPLVNDPDSLEVAAGAAREELRGWSPELRDQDVVRDVINKAFQYRGDVTITKKDGTRVDGYVSNRHSVPSFTDSTFDIQPNTGGESLGIFFADVEGVAFSGHDMASGKSWDAWIRRRQQSSQSGDQD